MTASCSFCPSALRSDARAPFASSISIIRCPADLTAHARTVSPELCSVAHASAPWSMSTLAQER
eukprot:1176437-Prymnesium_polylepis.2